MTPKIKLTGLRSGDIGGQPLQIQWTGNVEWWHSVIIQWCLWNPRKFVRNLSHWEIP